MGSRLIHETDPTPSPVIERLEAQIDALKAENEHLTESVAQASEIIDAQGRVRVEDTEDFQQRIAELEARIANLEAVARLVEAAREVAEAFEDTEPSGVCTIEQAEAVREISRALAAAEMSIGIRKET